MALATKLYSVSQIPNVVCPQRLGLMLGSEKISLHRATSKELLLHEVVLDDQPCLMFIILQANKVHNGATAL